MKLSIAIIAIAFSLNAPICKAQNAVLWYTYPAKYWNSQALHLGNGFIGASFFGGIEEEKFALTEESIWTGSPFKGDWEDYGINPKANEYLPIIRKAVVNNQVQLADSLSQKYYLPLAGNFRKQAKKMVLYISPRKGSGPD